MRRRRSRRDDDERKTRHKTEGEGNKDGERKRMIHRGEKITLK